jgi:hypothetical protein
VTAFRSFDALGILFGYGNGSFSDTIIYSTGAYSQPIDIAVGDFKSDNISDLAITNYGNNNIMVLFGIGDGFFFLGTTYSTGDPSSPYALAVGDFNNDTRLDIAVTSGASNNIRIFLGNGPHLFGSMTPYKIYDGSKPHSIAIGDINNDGHQDIVLANYGSDSVGVILGLANRSFNYLIRYLYGSGSTPYSIALAHFNDDSYLDIVVANFGTDNIAISLGFGNGTFAFATLYPTGTGSAPHSVTVADLDNDKRLDIAVANSGTSQLFLLYGNGNGTFGNETIYGLGYKYNPYSIAVKDLNQDNQLDIVIACYGTDHVEIFIKTC